MNYFGNGALICDLKGVDKKLTEATLGKMYSIKIVESIKELDKAEWNAMIDDNVFASYGWLKTVEETFIRDINPKYIIVLDSSKLIGASVCYLINKMDKSGYLDNLLLGPLKKFTSKLGISFLPTFLRRPMRCYGKHLLIAKEIDSKYKIIIADQLLTAIEKEASCRGLSVCFDNVMEDEGKLIQLLKKRGYIRTLGYPLNYLDIEWSSFEGYKNYVKSISKNMQKNIAKEINNNYYKHNQSLFPFTSKFFIKLKENLGEDVVFYASFKKGSVTGVCTLFKRNKTGYLPIVGVDYEKAGNDATYFNILFYRPIMDAISEQMSMLYYGNAMYNLKAKRGCKINNTYIYYKPSNKFLKTIIKQWFTLHSLWSRKKYTKIL